MFESKLQPSKTTACASSKWIVTPYELFSDLYNKLIKFLHFLIERAETLT